jgi:NAD(P)H-hydrate epimerase
MFITNAAQIREIDRVMMEEYAFAPLLLMETAGRKAADKIGRLYENVSQFLILCGAANNGGDGLVVARYLHQMGRKVWVLFSHSPQTFRGDTLINFEIVMHAGIRHSSFGETEPKEIEAFLKEGTIIIDALVGTGLRSELREPAFSMIAYFKQINNGVVALDMPSGLLADTGAVLTPPLRCEHTLTFQLPKFCHYVTPAANFCGKVHVIDIGIYPHIPDRLGIKSHLLTDELIAGWYRPRDKDSHKGSYGHVLLAGGSRGKAGAIALSAQSANMIGAGLCTAYIPGSAVSAFHRTTLENMSVAYGKENVPYLNGTAADVFLSYLADKNAVVIGPGLGHTQDTADFFANVLPHIQLPLILDADALNLLADDASLWDNLPAQTILTPHPGEMARLIGADSRQVQARRLESALQLAVERKVIVVLKGAGTLIALPDGTLYVCQEGNPGMATAGSGDVLAGAIAGLVAQGYSPAQSAAMGVYIHARAGDRIARIDGVEGVVASKLMRALGMTLKDILYTGQQQQGKQMGS